MEAIEEQKIDPSRLHFIGPNVEVLALDMQYCATLWTRTLQDNIPNQRLFRQLYGMDCKSTNECATILTAAKQAGTHHHLMVRPLFSPSPTNWMSIQLPTSTSSPLLCARFLENTHRHELHLEALYLLHCHVFDELHYNSTHVRNGSLETGDGMRNQRSLLGSFRRSLFVPEAEQVSDLFVLPKEKWPATKAASAAWLGMEVEGQRGVVEKSAKALGL